MNHFTLHVKDPMARAEIAQHKESMLRKISTAVIGLVLLSSIFTFISFYTSGNGHPMLLVTSGVNVFLVLLYFTQFLFRVLKFVDFFFYLYFLNHTIATVLVYMDWIPESFKAYGKFNFEW